MLFGIVIYVISSLLCAFSTDIESLISFRLLQAFGGRAVTVVAIAIVKDLFDGREREKIMATIMSLVIIAPMVAPVLGAFLLKIASWHMMFVALAVFGCIAGVFALCYKETLHKRYTGSVLRSLGRLGVVLKNSRFTSLLAIFSLTPMALMGFLAAGSYIYIDFFGLTEQEFSYAFAFNAFFASFGPTIYMKLSKRVSVQKIISVCFIVLTGCGVLTYTIADASPWFFALLAAPATLAVITIRVPATNLMLDQQDTDTGSAVALIQFFSMMFGALGMVLVSLRPDALINNLGSIQFFIGLTCGVFWFLVKNKPYVDNKLIKLSQ